MWEFFVKGGIIMYPLALCSITSLIIIVERLLFYFRGNQNDERETNLLTMYLEQNKYEEAKLLISKWNSPFARITEAALKQVETAPGLVENAVQQAGDIELSKLQRGLGMLDTIVTASPLLGLLGTVLGIIRSFGALALTNGHTAQLSQGIAEALFATAFGLGIAIPTLFFVNIFYGIAEKRVQALVNYGRETIARFQKN